MPEQKEMGTTPPPGGKEAASLLPSTVAKVEKVMIAIGRAVSWLNALLLLIILIQVIQRYIFNYASVTLEELQWHLYAVGIMAGLSYAMTMDTHVRLDLLYEHFPKRAKEWVDLLGTVLLVLPWCVVVFFHGVDFTQQAWRVAERSYSPTGLCCYYLIKSAIPISFFLLFISALARVLKSYLYLRGRGE